MTLKYDFLNEIKIITEFIKKDIYFILFLLLMFNIDMKNLSMFPNFFYYFKLKIKSKLVLKILFKK